MENYEWNQIQTTGIKPKPRFGHKAVINHEKMYIFGGEDKHGNKLNDLTCLNLGKFCFKKKIKKKTKRNL